MLIKKSFITLVSTQNYLMGALVLQKSLRNVNSKYPLTVALTQDLYTLNNIKLLSKYNIHIEVIDKLEYCDKAKLGVKKDHSVLNTASKIEIFKLQYYDKLVYLDADMLVMDNIDDLFNYPDGSMIGFLGYRMGFSACLVIEPKYHVYEYYKLLLDNVVAFDGNLLGNLWVQCKHPAFRIPSAYCETDKCLPCKIYHFINQPKPWMNDYKFTNAKCDQLYLQYLNEIKEAN